MKTELINGVVLAYLGDAVLELLVREYLVKHTDIAKLNDYQKEAVAMVSATAQQAFVLKALENNWLTDREIDIYKRARNTKITRNESVAHNYSTGFEAIIGALYLEENKERIDEIFKLLREK